MTLCYSCLINPIGLEPITFTKSQITIAQKADKCTTCFSPLLALAPKVEEIEEKEEEKFLDEENLEPEPE